MSEARSAAAWLLTRIETEGAYSNIILPAYFRSHSLSEEDRSFVTALVRGCTERRLTLRYDLSLYLKKPEKLPPFIFADLEIGAYQLLFMDGIPAAVAVNESVETASKAGFGRLTGVVNAVLRRIASQGLCLPPINDKAGYLSVKYSYPKYLVEALIRDYGFDEAVAFMKSSTDSRGFFVRMNPLRCSPEEFESALTAEGVTLVKQDYPEYCYHAVTRCDVAALDSFNKGFFHVQDRSSQICCEMLSPREGELIYDTCAAPGGKSFTIAEIANDRARIISSDVHENKLDLIRSGAQRLGLSSINVTGRDASFESWDEQADRILCDVPCSGWGAASHKPEIRYRSEKENKSLPSIQLGILVNVSHYLKPGGVLVYSTCTVNKTENEDICNGFISLYPEFDYDTGCCPERLNGRGYATFMPQKDGTNGFFVAVLRRT